MARKRKKPENKTKNKTTTIGPAIAYGIGTGIQWTNHIYQFLSIILILKFSGEMLPELIIGTDKIGEIAGLPLASIFQGGIITVLILAIIISTIMKNANKMTK